ncbi:MAG: hypothetical protein HUJ70_08680 [Pseudobutyrivibrio sp.]|nr:hypothetical protein [Pseudobutyrivibrio sp.]
MIDVTEAFKQKWLDRNVQKQITVKFPDGEHQTLDGDRIQSESLEFRDNLCSQGEFKFGICEANYVSFSAYLINDIPIKSKIVIELKVDGLEETLPLGEFTVKSTKYDWKSQLTKVEAYGHSVIESDSVSATEQFKRRQAFIDTVSDAGAGKTYAKKYIINPYRYVMQETGLIFDECELNQIQIQLSSIPIYSVSSKQGANVGYIYGYNFSLLTNNFWIGSGDRFTKLFIARAQKTSNYNSLFETYGKPNGISFEPVATYTKKFRIRTSASSFNATDLYTDEKYLRDFLPLEYNKPFETSFSPYVGRTAIYENGVMCSVDIRFPVYFVANGTSERQYFYENFELYEITGIPNEDVYLQLEANVSKDVKYYYDNLSGVKTAVNLTEYYLDESLLNSNTSIINGLSSFWELLGKFYRFNRQTSKIEEVWLPDAAVRLIDNNELIDYEYLSSKTIRFGKIVFDYKKLDAAGESVIELGEYVINREYDDIYYVQNNPFLTTDIISYDEAVSKMSGLIECLSQIYWNAMDLSAVGIPWLEAKDIVTWNGKKSFVFQKNAKGIQAMIDTISGLESQDYSDLEAIDAKPN